MQHRLATPVFQPRMYFFDADGKPLVGGKVYSFKVGADEFKPTYRNSEFTAANQNPVLLDQAGSALIYVRGSNQLKIYNKQGSLIEEKIVYQQQMQTQFFDNYGKALSNGKIWTYDYQSTIKKTSYKYEDIQNPNPVVLDQDGWGVINIVGAYRLRVLDKNNVVVGDQDFKRPPVSVLTSRVYPLYFEEGVMTDFAILGGDQRIVMNEAALYESVETSFSLLSASMRDVMNSYITEPERLTTSFALIGATMRSAINSDITPQPEKINTSFVITSAQQNNSLLTNTTQPETIKTSFALISARITN